MAAKQRMNLDISQAEAKEQIKQVLAQSPRQFGLSVVRWRLADIQAVIGWLKSKSKGGTQKILRRLGFSYKQATAFIRSPDPLFRLKVRRISQAFAHALWHPKQAAILFEDELSFYRNPEPAPAWGERGYKQPTVAKAPGTDTLTRIGAVMDGLTGQVRYLQADKFGILAMRQLYGDLRHDYGQERIYVVQDNCPSVHKHPTVLQTAKELGIVPLFLPTYASWLNPIEKLWRWLKADVLHNHPWAHDLGRLRQETATFLDQFHHPNEALLAYVGLLPV